MKNLKLFALSAAIFSVITSCQKDEIIDNTHTEVQSLTKKHQDALWKAGVNPNGAIYTSVRHLDEPNSIKGILSDDIFIALDKLTEQALESENPNSKQYRTNNLVSRGRTISVVGYTGGDFALTSIMRAGLQRAINTYNAQNISLNFVLRFETTTNADMVIYNAGGSGAGGQADFPSGGRPGKFIKIFGGMNSQSSNNNTHVIIHEMGHALGLRHTDFARRRCGNNNEQDSASGQAAGAIYIPGTPRENRWGVPGIDTDSVMISCFGNEDGRISNFDRISLEYLY